MTNGVGSGGVPVLRAAPAADAGAALLRRGTGYAVVAGAAGAVASGFWGWRAVAGFAVGGALAVAALAVGPVLLRASRNASPPAVMAVAMAGYTGVVIVLGAVFLALGSLTWLSSGHLAAALVAVTVAGLAGQIRAVTRLRVPVFATPLVERSRPSGAAGDGDAAQSSPEAGR
jgi:hypothetical protein